MSKHFERNDHRLFFLFSATAVTNKHKVSDLCNTNLLFYKSEDQESIIKIGMLCSFWQSRGRIHLLTFSNF